MKNCAIFRYPGGKLKLAKLIIPHFSKACGNIDFNDEFDYLEPFVGGGGMTINVAKKFPKAKIFINDLDENIYHFWDILCDEDPKRLDKVKTLLTNAFPERSKMKKLDYFNKLRKTKPKNDVEKAFQSVFFNKTTFSGMSFSTPIGGVRQTGKWKVDCYYKPPLLLKRIDNLRNLLVGRTTVTGIHYRDFIKKYMNGDNYVCYLDPPYYEQGSKLYPVFMKPKEHEELAKILESKDNWILSYDKCNEIDKLYSWATREPIKMIKSMVIATKDKRDKISEYVIYKQKANTVKSKTIKINGVFEVEIK